jgi:hypothetical protein
MEFMCKDTTLNDNMLRGRTEAQFPTLQYSPERKDIAITDSREQFPVRVYGQEDFGSYAFP